MNSKNSKTSDPHRLLLNLSDKADIKKSCQYAVSSNLSIYYTLEKHKKVTQNSKLKIAAPT